MKKILKTRHSRRRGSFRKTRWKVLVEENMGEVAFEAENEVDIRSRETTIQRVQFSAIAARSLAIKKQIVGEVEGRAKAS